MFLHQIVNEEWIWLLHTNNETGKTVSKIYSGVVDVNIFNKDDWPSLISFFKQRIIALDEFWNFVKYNFEALR